MFSTRTLFFGLVSQTADKNRIPDGDAGWIKAPDELVQSRNPMCLRNFHVFTQRPRRQQPSYLSVPGCPSQCVFTNKLSLLWTILFLYLSLNWIINFQIYNMIYWSRPKTSDWGHKLPRKMSSIKAEVALFCYCLLFHWEYYFYNQLSCLLVLHCFKDYCQKSRIASENTDGN